MVDVIYRRHREGDGPAIARLLDKAFGPNRLSLSSYRLREKCDDIPELSLLALQNEAAVGSIQYWPIRIGDETDALLLGPLAVDPDLKGRGIGRALMAQTLDRAAARGDALVLLVGDLDYYAASGFTRVTGPGLIFPGPVDPKRLLYRRLDGLREIPSGVVAPTRSNDFRATR